MLHPDAAIPAPGTGYFYLVRFEMGLGLATGMACIGNIGARERFNYTAIGNTVNVAARLEAACRHVEFDILADRAVLEASPGLAWLPAGNPESKGV